MDEGLGQRLAHALRVARHRRHLSQHDVASACGVTIQSLSSYETGAHLPRLEVFCRLARWLDLDLQTVIGPPIGSHPIVPTQAEIDVERLVVQAKRLSDADIKLLVDLVTVAARKRGSAD
jgi:transcriptional regulator with XRE-family HTH domain